MTVKITNLSQSAIVITLYHKQYCDNGAPCKCKPTVLIRTTQNKDGSKGIFRIEKLLSDNLRIEVGATVKGVHDAILNLPHVKSMLKKRPPTIRVAKEVTKQPVVKTVNKNPVPVKPAPIIADAPIAPIITEEEPTKEPRSSTRKRGRKRSQEEK